VTARRQTRWLSRRRGAVAVEYALILPALLLFLLGIMDVGRLLWVYTTLSRAAEAAARCAAINTIECGTAAQIQNFAKAEAWGLTIDSAAFTVSTPACGVQVQGIYEFKSVIPGLNAVAPLGTITLKATACYPLTL
jgi:Flp pilus assembly protein TadG